MDDTRAPQRTVVLARISDARNGDEHGVTGQVKDARVKAHRLGWTVGPDCTHIVVENDTSAFKRQKITLPNGRTELRTVRPGFRKVLDMLASGEADGLIALDLNRTCRDPRDLEDLIDAVESRRPGIPVESVTGSLRLSNDAEVTMARVLVSMANKSSRDTARRVRARRKDTAEAGTYGGGRRPYGYRADPDAPKYAKQLIVVEDEAAEIKRLAAALLAGASLRTLVADLRERGVPTVTQTMWAAMTPKQQAQALKDGKRDGSKSQWDAASVKDILLKPSVAGLAVYDVRGEARKLRDKGEPVPYDCGVVGPALWTPILDETTWRQLAELITDPARRCQGSTAPKWLGSLLYRCGVCEAAGITETVVIMTGSAERERRYKCRSSAHVTRTVTRVDEYVVDRVLAHLATTPAAKLVPQPDMPDRDALRKEADVLRQRKAMVLRLTIDGSFTEAEARQQSKPLNDRLAEIDRALTASTEKSPLTALPIGNAVRVPGVSGTGVRRKAELLEAHQEMRARWDALPLGHQRAILRKTATITLLKGQPGRRPNGSYFNGDATIRIDWL